VKLTTKEKKHQAEQNYHDFRSKVKFGEAPITNAQKRQTQCGKGDGNRVKNFKKYQENYMLVKWNSRKG
jgi:hypothetical protein